MKKRPFLMLLLACLAGVTPALAYPPAPFYQIYGNVRNSYGNPLGGNGGTVILSGIYSAFGTTTVTSGRITYVNIVNGGSGYTSAPTVQFTGANGAGTGATGTAVLTNGVVTGVTMTQQGSGYTAPVIVGLTGGGGKALEITRSITDPTISPGVNYSLSVPMDSGTTSLFYDATAMRPQLPFTIRVVIEGVNYVPIQIAAAPKLFWKTAINQVNPGAGIQSTGNNWAIGLPTGKLRLDLWLGVDSNGDGLPDEWQQDVVDSDASGQLTNFTEVDPNADLSGNGLTNLQKFLAGVYALDSSDGLKLKIDSVSNGIANLHFQTVTGRTYHLSKSQDLKTWTDTCPFSLSSDGTNPVSYYLASGSEILKVHVPVGSAASNYFTLYVE